MSRALLTLLVIPLAVFAATNPIERGAGPFIRGKVPGGVTSPPLPPLVLPPGPRVEESDPKVSFVGAWSAADPRLGWSGGSAMQSNAPGATVSINFTGNSIRWIGSRGRKMGIATVTVDGGPARDVNLFGRPTDEAHTTVVTLSDLGSGPHTLTINVTGRKDSQADGNFIVVDAFDIDPGTTISHWQDTNPGIAYSDGWTKSDIALPFSGTGVSNVPELPVSAHETSSAGKTVTLPFRGSEIAWIGYRGPDAGMASVQIDGTVLGEVDLYSPTVVYQAVVFAKTGLGDADHTLVIQNTGRRNAAANGTRVVVDAFDVTTPGRRYEQYEPAITYSGAWTLDNSARVWTEGVTATSNQPGATATFRFVGTSVSWIGCSKGSAGGTANIYIDDKLQKQVRLSQDYPIEGYQMTIFRADGLPNGPHALKIEVVNTDGSYIVVDAFDVR
jgi:hypothetical protein